MNQLFQENRNAFLLLLALLFILLAAVYFFFYRPHADELAQKMRQEEALTEEIALLKTRIAGISEDDSADIGEVERMLLERNIPREAELDQFLLSLNEIELLSNSRIESMSFGYDGSLPNRFEPVPDANQDDVGQVQAHLETTEEREDRLAAIEAEKVAETERETGETQEVGGTTTFAMAELPEGLEPIVVSLDVLSPDYEHFQLFLQEIEKQERIMIVPSLSFDKPAENELIFAENPDETISVTVDVMTFYYEG
ncbi:hypothetical protein [Oceanobacillus sp. CAU 1775]